MATERDAVIRFQSSWEFKMIRRLLYRGAQNVPELKVVLSMLSQLAKELERTRLAMMQVSREADSIIACVDEISQTF